MRVAEFVIGCAISRGFRGRITRCFGGFFSLSKISKTNSAELRLIMPADIPSNLRALSVKLNINLNFIKKFKRENILNPMAQLWDYLIWPDCPFKLNINRGG
jgi:hypothetical protein